MSEKRRNKKQPQRSHEARGAIIESPQESQERPQQGSNS